MARPAKYNTPEERRAANAARQAGWRQRRHARRTEAEWERNETQAAARTIMAEALTHISYSYRSDIEREWVKRWPWLKCVDETEASS